MPPRRIGGRRDLDLPGRSTPDHPARLLVQQVQREGQTLTYLENIGTFNAANPLEIRQNGILALGALGFNVPSLLGVGYHSPYLHNGAAQTLEAVYPLHNLGGGTIASTFTSQQLSDLTIFLKTVDGRTDLLRSAADDFRDALALP